MLLTAPLKEAIIWNLQRANLGGFLMFFVPFAEDAHMRDLLRADYIPMGFDLRSS
jgi:hypothetical protein